MKRGATLGITLAAAFWSLLLVVSSSWIADGLNDDCLWEWLLGSCRAGTRLPGAGRVLVAAVLFGVAAVFVYRIAKNIVRVRHLARAEVKPHAGLIAAISPFAARYEEVEDGLLLIGNQRDNECRDKEYRVVLVGRLDEDIDAVSQAGWRWQGQQFLRALRPHFAAGALQRLVLIGSDGKGGSFGSLGLAERLARLYCRDLHIERQPNPIEFENLESLHQCFDDWIDRFIALGFAESDIVIDATGGLKTTSIAAALTTLHRPQVQFQYVQTQPSASDGRIHVIAFDVVAESLQWQAGD